MVRFCVTREESLEKKWLDDDRSATCMLGTVIRNSGELHSALECNRKGLKIPNGLDACPAMQSVDQLQATVYTLSKLISWQILE